MVEKQKVEPNTELSASMRCSTEINRALPHLSSQTPKLLDHKKAKNGAKPTWPKGTRPHYAAWSFILAMGTLVTTGQMHAMNATVRWLGGSTMTWYIDKCPRTTYFENDVPSCFNLFEIKNVKKAFPRRNWQQTS